MLLFALLSCTPAPPESDATDDSAAEGDADTDTDSDTDVDCTTDDLLFKASLTDANGNCTSCTSPVNVLGSVTNTCESGSMQLTLRNDCLVKETLIEYQDGSGEVHRSAPSGCSSEETILTIPAGETEQAVAAGSIGLGTGTYSLTLTFNDGRPNRAGKVFDVQ